MLMPMPNAHRSADDGVMGMEWERTNDFQTLTRRKFQNDIEFQLRHAQNSRWEERCDNGAGNAVSPEMSHEMEFQQHYFPWMNAIKWAGHCLNYRWNSSRMLFIVRRSPVARRSLFNAIPNGLDPNTHTHIHTHAWWRSDSVRRINLIDFFVVGVARELVTVLWCAAAHDANSKPNSAILYQFIVHFDPNARSTHPQHCGEMETQAHSPLTHL